MTIWTPNTKVTRRGSRPWDKEGGGGGGGGGAPGPLEKGGGGKGGHPDS